MKVLHIDSSILGEGSASRALTREIVGRLRAEHPDAEINYLDLAAEALPHLDRALAIGKLHPKTVLPDFVKSVEKWRQQALRR